MMLSSWEIKMVQLLKLTLRVTCGDLGVLLSSDTVSATPCTLSIPMVVELPHGEAEPVSHRHRASSGP